MQDLCAYLAHKGLLYDDMGIDRVPIIEQHHGDIVHVPAGHMHQVENLDGCVKMAWDKYVVAHLDLTWTAMHCHGGTSPIMFGGGGGLHGGFCACENCHSGVGNQQEMHHLMFVFRFNSYHCHIEYSTAS